jgi:hypothetical protein
MLLCGQVVVKHHTRNACMQVALGKLQQIGGEIK